METLRSYWKGKQPVQQAMGDGSSRTPLSPPHYNYNSRRSVVYGTKGVVAASQPLAVEAGLEILRKGGNAGELIPYTPRVVRLAKVTSALQLMLL